MNCGAIRPKQPSSIEEARRIVGEFVEHYNQVRRHSAIGYIAPADQLAGRAQEIWRARDAKLDTAREARRQRRQQPCAA
jgi:transposase InsO family protein